MGSTDSPDTGGDRPERGRKAVPLRIDPEVYRALAKWAADDLRSVNAQIEFLLRRALDDAGRMPSRVRPMRGPGRPPANPDQH
ncbi:hypothetical protein TPB0596_42040 [Tsukamurella pulmonis]|uniref:CopG-like ribbon-helix-helix domain-containing protein n=1 Tax=Tsukamurella pulmonis TaxID=47312 RepID=A0A1H1BGZ7_9ACTN|nr:hypothetical protein [Tsukamurella pulmonis]KXO90341.1 hypothetical protein AXK56_09565 [Tsukamurella pulmonis]KXP08651.1 hypothetical protein AXK57_15900 [Tsukamurella pulmonis]RDH09679.1 hypothetical protein DVB88_22215 [Tsukamurella pulmonis]SDQ51228.1 hypothetical protein SAMN04489765_0696 [Tsukamurella pulmonis]SUP25173.1 Uncharacterised protein [Tsukamurella pulmonis]